MNKRMFHRVVSLLLLVTLITALFCTTAFAENLFEIPESIKNYLWIDYPNGATPYSYLFFTWYNMNIPAVPNNGSITISSLTNGTAYWSSEELISVTATEVVTPPHIIRLYLSLDSKYDMVGS